MRIIQSLEKWEFAAAAPGKKADSAPAWRPATVPGDVRSNLLSLGAIQDPYFDNNYFKQLWIDETDWIYRVRFQAGRPEAGKRLFLKFGGIDYKYEITFNGGPLLKSEGMFSPHVFDITNMIETSNDLNVRLLALREQLLDKLISIPLPNNQFGRHERLKMHMSYGWDFAPAMKNAGIWEPVTLIETGSVFIKNLRIISELSGNIKLKAELDSSAPFNGELKIFVQGENFKARERKFSAPLKLAAGDNLVETEFTIKNPRLWTVWEQGFPHLYKLRADVVSNQGETIDSTSDAFGIRTVTREPFDPQKPEAKWVFRVNGKRLFIRGFNWVPPDSLLGRIDARKYETLIGRAREANANLLRVWGGGLREKPDFYNICDRTGILVWQEFPFACAFLRNYPRAPEFRDLVRREISSIIRELRNHPSVALWSGGNEFSQKRNPSLVNLLDELQKENDATREFIPASPCPGSAHNYQVWHYYGGLKRYAQERQYFVSEFGLQGVPDLESLKQFLPPGKLWPPNKSWIDHHFQAPKAFRYALPFLKKLSLEDFIRASQDSQAFYLKMGVEMWRRRKFRIGGTVIWQLDEPWPAICWSQVDYFNRPKKSFYMLQDVYNPVLVSLEFTPKPLKPGHDFKAPIWVINDLHEVLDHCRLIIKNSAGRELMNLELNISPDSASEAATLEIKNLKPEDFNLALCLEREGKIISKNQYDLGQFDPIEMPQLADRFTHWAHNWLMR